LFRLIGSKFVSRGINQSGTGLNFIILGDFSVKAIFSFGGAFH